MIPSVPVNPPPFGLAPWTLARFRAPYGFCPTGEPPTVLDPIEAKPLSAFVSCSHQGFHTGLTHVALIDTRALTDLTVAQHWVARLPSATQARLARIHHPERQAESLGGRLIAACFAKILGQSLREDPPYAPLFEVSGSSALTYDLSLAHSHGLAVVALHALSPSTARPQIAVDLERVRDRSNIHEIVSHSLGEDFWGRLSTFEHPEDPHATLLAFYRLWGEYECAIKLSRFSRHPYRVHKATDPRHGFTLCDPMGNSLETQALLLAAPTRDSPQTPFVL